MQSTAPIILTIVSLTRQFLNCWLEYVLSQPVDFDISVMLHFLRSYLGVPAIVSLFRGENSNDSGDFMIGGEQEMIPELLSQETLS